MISIAGGIVRVMPMVEYECGACGERGDELVASAAGEAPRCGVCGGGRRRVWSGAPRSRVAFTPEMGYEVTGRHFGTQAAYEAHCAATGVEFDG